MLGMPSCEELARHGLSGTIEEASVWKRMMAPLHMAICVHCRRFKSQVSQITQAFRRSLDRSVDQARIDALKKRIQEGI